MEWEPIKQYEGKSELPGVSEMEALKLVWADYREYFGPEMTKSIQDRFNREWSIETGLIEGAYYIDKGITVTLVDQGIKASLIDRQQNGKSPEQVANILLDQVGAIEGLFAFVNGSSPLTTSYIRQLHQQLMRSEDFIPFIRLMGSLFRRLSKRESTSHSRTALYVRMELSIRIVLRSRLMGKWSGWSKFITNRWAYRLRCRRHGCIMLLRKFIRFRMGTAEWRELWRLWY